MEYYQSNTMGLLRFYMHRDMLTGLLEIVGSYDGLSGKVKHLIDKGLKAELPVKELRIWRVHTHIAGQGRSQNLVNTEKSSESGCEKSSESGCENGSEVRMALKINPYL